MSPACSGEGCPKKNSCGRFSPSIDRTKDIYLASVPYKPSTGKCEFYWGFNEDLILKQVKGIIDGSAAKDKG